MNIDRRCGAVAVALACFATLGVLIGGGPLNPPAGAVSPTAKTLAEVEPRVAVNAANTPGDANSEFIISSPGSYSLTGNLSASKTNVISITGDNVTLDLNGFTVSNTLFSSSARAVVVAGTNATIRNGTLATVGRGINCVVANLTMTVDQVSVRTGSSGIVFPGYATVTRCLVSQNADSTTQTFLGISVGPRSRVSECTVLMSTFSTTPASNESITAGAGSIVESCTINGGGIGVLMTDGIVRGCRLQEQNNTGIRVNGGVCENNSIASVTGIGISCGNAEVRGNRVVGVNTPSSVGIYITGGSNTIAKNTVSTFNGTNGYGIATFSNTNLGGNKIMENELVNNWRHLNITAPYNLIVRNSMSFVGAGGNVSFAVNNSFGPVINAGNTDLSTVAGSSHPQANFTY